MFNIPFTFESTPELGTLTLIVLLSGLVSFIFHKIIKLFYKNIEKPFWKKNELLVLKLSDIIIASGTAFFLGSGFGWWALTAGIIGGGFSTFIANSILKLARWYRDKKTKNE